MSSQTTNLHLVKPEYGESADVSVFNSNMELIDSYAGTVNSGKAAKSEAIKNITRSGTTFTATRADGTTFTFTQQDNDHYAWSDITGKPANYPGGCTGTAGGVAWGNVSSKPSYYDGSAIKNITRSGTTFTATKMDGTTFTFTQQDNNTTYSAGTDLGLSGTTFNHSNSGVSAGTYGPSGNVTGNNGTTIYVPQITVNARGHVTSLTNRTYTSVNTDTNTWRPVQNNLNSTSTSDCLSANMGHVLFGMIDGKLDYSSGNATRNTTYTSSGNCSWYKQKCGHYSIVHVSLDCYPVSGKSSENVAIYFTGLPVPVNSQPQLIIGPTQALGNFTSIAVDSSGNLRPWYCGTIMGSHCYGTFTYMTA